MKAPSLRPLALLSLGLSALVLGACGSDVEYVDSPSEEQSPAEADAAEAKVVSDEAGDAGEAGEDDAKGPSAPGPDDGPPDPLRIMSPLEADPNTPRGVLTNALGALEGYTLVTPLNSTKSHLVDMEGEIAHTWELDSSPGACTYLLEDGTLLRAGREDEDPHFRGGGIGGRVQMLAPDGELIWNWSLATEERHQHHDIEPMPNGNVLVIVWERVSRDEAIARGRDPRGVGAPGLWPDAVYEVKPVLPNDAEIVWEWRSWDHLVQDRDESLPNYGAIAENPHRIDVNAGFVPEESKTEEERQEEEELEDQMAALGYAGGDDEEEEPAAGADEKWNRAGDWLHTNSVDYHAELDLIVLSSPELCELWIIDHSTTTEEARGSSGGRYGRGGDLLWRWGNPAMHGAGDETGQRLFYQHNPTLFSGGGDANDLRLLVFNNGGGRPNDENYSSLDELALPFDAAKGFTGLGPDETAWSYSSPDTFYSAFISGAQRLPNGNTLACSGASGHIVEVTPDGTVVWDYFSPLGGDVQPPDHAGKAPPLALFRATRFAKDDPAIVALGL